MEKSILTLSVIAVYNVSAGAVGGVKLTHRPCALKLHRDRPPSLHIALVNETELKYRDQTGTAPKCPV